MLGDLDGVDRDLAAARIVRGVEGHLLAFMQVVDAGALERGGMNKHILLAVIRRDEAEAFLSVVELDDARNHEMSFRFRCARIQLHISRVWLGLGTRASRASSRFVDFGSVSET